MPFSKSVPLSYLIGLITCKVPANWVRLVCLVVFFAVVLSGLPVRPKHDGVNAQSSHPGLTQGPPSHNLPDLDETYANVASGRALKGYGHRSWPSPITAQSGGVVTVSPGSYQTPDPSQGGLAVNSPSNTGQGPTIAEAFSTGGTVTQTKTSMWHSFQSVNGTATAITLKFEYLMTGIADAVSSMDEFGNAGMAGGYSSFDVEYSINGGASWASAVHLETWASACCQNISSFNSFASPNFPSVAPVSVAIPPSTPISQIRVRSRLLAEASAQGEGLDNAYGKVGDSNPTSRIQNIRLEVEAWNCIASVPADNWKGEYFNNQTLSGSPTMVRNEGAGTLNLNFSSSSPHSACAPAADNFSARWTRTVNLAEGIYHFTASVDNGVRLYVDGYLRIDQWGNFPPNTYTADVFVSAGAHEIKVEFVEYTGGASVSLSWAAVSGVNCYANVPADRWKGEYYSNPNLSGSAAMVRDDGPGPLDFDFGGGGPGGSCGLGPDYFSARWTRTVSFANGTYRFTATIDNGVRLYVDGQLKIDQWANLPPNTYTADVFLPAGDHQIKLEFFETWGGARASLSWADISNCIANVPADRWRGEYFNNITLSGSPLMVQDAGAGSLNFDFGLGSPGAACGIGVDNFSARWTRTVSFGSGLYRFSVTGDDGVRLYVDGQPKIDKWFPQGATTYTADVALPAGNHEVKLEYFEGGGPGVAILIWTLVRGPGCLPNSPLTGAAPLTGAGESVATTPASEAPKRCGQKSSD